ncbi:MAG: hypothetical protein EBZ48_14395, partial [Proteobacteria bacterium]|nr:hypothetical protein [Pseudomonadota bacterium]
VASFLHAVEEMGKFPWEGMVRYLGEKYVAAELPWHYPLVWIAATTPPLFLVLFGVGSLVSLKRAVSAPCIFLRQYQTDLIAAAALVLPVALVLITRATLYDGWRHLFFIFPLVLYFAVVGFEAILSILQLERFNRVRRYLFPVVVATPLLSLGILAGTLRELHPLQNVYFNFVAAPNARENFELDYWGISHLQILRYLLATDSTSPILVSATEPAARFNTKFLPESDRNRIAFRPVGNRAHYFLTTHRFNPSIPRNFERFYVVKRLGIEIAYIYKRTQ